MIANAIIQVITQYIKQLGNTDVKSIFSILKDEKYIAQITSRANNRHKKNNAIEKQIINLKTGRIFFTINAIVFQNLVVMYFRISKKVADIL